MQRRNFLKVTTAGTAGLLISSCDSVTRSDKSPSDQREISYTINPLLRIGENNTVHVILSRVEMGQGIWTTLPTIIAEELEYPLDRIIVEHAPPGKAEDFLEPPVLQATGGSETTRSQFETYRMAGATAKKMLVQAAAERFKAPPGQCRAHGGKVFFKNDSYTYGELAKEASKLPIPAEVDYKEPTEWKLIGRSQKRLDTAVKINGKAEYGIDIHLPGLLTAIVAHAPVFGGTVLSHDDSRAMAVNGVREIIILPTGVAVVADGFWPAKMGREALDIQWEKGANAQTDSSALKREYRDLSQKEGKVIQEKGDVERALSSLENTLHVSYSFPFLAHAPMEPLNCTVRIGADKCEVWAGTQSPLLHQAEVAGFLDLRPEQVHFYTPHIGGSFGRRGSFSRDWIMEAVQIAKIVGKPIKLIWSREDDIKGGYYRPIYVHDVKIGIGKDGFPSAWKHTVIGQSLFKDTPLQEYLVVNGIDYSSVTTSSPYSDSISDKLFQLITTEAGVPVLPWRSVGNTHTAFVVETLIDELAARAKKDPVEYRHYLYKDHPRHLRVLELAAEKGKWSEPAEKGIYKGIAVHEAMGSIVSQIIEISISDQTIHVHRVVCAIDCGLAVNPDGVIAQIEGSIAFGLTAALYGEIELREGEVVQSNFHDYRMLRIGEMPKVEVHIASSTDAMGGAGEPGVPPVAPALANAIFAATGTRLRDLPLKLRG